VDFRLRVFWCHRLVAIAMSPCSATSSHITKFFVTVFISLLTTLTVATQPLSLFLMVMKTARCSSPWWSLHPSTPLLCTAATTPHRHHPQATYSKDHCCPQPTTTDHGSPHMHPASTIHMHPLWQLHATSPLFLFHQRPSILDGWWTNHRWAPPPSPRAPADDTTHRTPVLSNPMNTCHVSPCPLGHRFPVWASMRDWKGIPCWYFPIWCFPSFLRFCFYGWRCRFGRDNCCLTLPVKTHIHSPQYQAEHH